MKPADLRGITLDDGGTEGDLAIGADHGSPRGSHGQDGGPFPASHLFGHLFLSI